VRPEWFGTERQPAAGLHSVWLTMQAMHMRCIFVTDEAKKKLWRPCREARALGL
jgi:hypothetical protein